MDARNHTIEEWFGWVRDGRVVLPRFQRFEAWDYSQVEGVLRNIVRRPALPVGALLTLEVGRDAPFVARPIKGAPEPKTTPQLHLLDGQQRLTALWRSLTADYEDMTFFVEVRPTATTDGEDEHDGNQPDVRGERRYWKNDQRYPRWCEDPASVWQRGLVPVSLLAPNEDSRQRLKEWTREASGGDFDEAAAINDAAGDLRGRVAGFKLPALSLPLDTDPSAALDVFIKMNTQNTALTAFDIVVAQVESALEQSLHEKVEGLRAEVPEVVRFGDPGLIAMQVGAVLSGRSPTRASFLSGGFGDALVEQWDAVERGLKRAIAFLGDERVFDGSRLPGDPLLTLMAAYWANAPEGGDDEGAARSLARRAFWTGAFSSRYEKTSATRTEADYRELFRYRDTGGDRPKLFDAEANPLPDAGALLTGGWPKTKDKLGRAILAASLRVGGLDFADAQPVGPGNLDKREYHHLFPKALIDSDHPRRTVFSALNCALISWRTNRNIGAKPPSVYIAERADEISISRDEVDRRLMSHAIPVEALRSDDFERFLHARAALVHSLMRKLCAGRDVGLSDVEGFDPETEDPMVA